jgi:hypothetical protein
MAPLTPQSAHHGYRISGKTQHRPSTPIEIPTRRKAIILPIHNSPIRRPASPELIFEMSPVSSDFPSSAHYPFSFSASQNTNEREPFMYQFPIPSTRYTKSRQRTLPTPQTAIRPVLSCSPVTITAAANPKPHQKERVSSASLSDEDDLPSAFDSLTPPVVVRTATTNKTTGFVPTIAIQPAMPTRVRTPVQPSRRSRHLSPPPRSSSFSSSPWILPGTGEILDADVASVETDPDAFDFERYLIRRIENEKPVRYLPVQPMPSMSVSVRG